MPRSAPMRNMTLVATLAAIWSAPGAAAAQKGGAAAQASTLVVDGRLPPEQSERLERWFTAVGEPRAREAFGELVVRAGKLQVGVPYFDAPPTAAPEALRVELGTFQCVSFVESSLAVARCAWARTPTEQCFVDEITSLRYRDARIDGYASRLHYFVEWLDESVERGGAELLTPALGGEPTRERFDYITRQPRRYPALADASVRTALSEVEQRLSAATYSVVPKLAAAAAQRQLRNGDVIAFVGSKPGIMVTHVGLVVRGATGELQVMHASSHHKRVVVTRTDLADYIGRRPERRGFMAVRPLAPDAAQPARAAP